MDEPTKKTVVIGEKAYQVPEEITKDQISLRVSNAYNVLGRVLDGEQIYLSKEEPSGVMPLLHTATSTAHYYLYFNRNKSLPTPLSVIRRGFEWHELANFFAQYAFPYDSDFSVGSKFSLFLNQESPDIWIRNAANFKNDFLHTTKFPFPVLDDLELYEENLDKILEDSKIPGKKYPLETEDKVLRHTEGFTNVRLRELSWYAFWYGGFKFDVAKDNPFIMVSLDGNESTYSDLNKILIDNGENDYKNEFTTSNDRNRVLGDSKTINRIILNVAFRSTQLLPLPPSAVNINTYLYNFATNKWDYVDTFRNCIMIIIQRMPKTLRDLFDNGKFDELENLGFKVKENGILFKLIEDVSGLMWLPIIFVKNFDNYISPNAFVEYNGEQYLKWANAMYHASQGEISYQEVPELNTLLSNKFLVGFSFEEPRNRDMSNDVLFICADHRTGAELPFSFMEQLQQSSLGLGLPYMGYEVLQLIGNGLLSTLDNFGINLTPFAEMLGLYNIDNDTIFSANSKKRYTAEYIKNEVIPSIKTTNDKISNLKNDIIDIFKDAYNDFKDALRGLTEGSTVSGRVPGVLSSIVTGIINAIIAGIGGIVIGLINLLDRIINIVKALLSIVNPVMQIVTWIGGILAAIAATVFSGGAFVITAPALIEALEIIAPIVGVVSQGIADIIAFFVLDLSSFFINIIGRMVSSVFGDGSGSLGGAVTGIFGTVNDATIRILRFILSFAILIIKTAVMLIVKILLGTIKIIGALLVTFNKFMGYLRITGDGWVTPNKHYISYGGKYDAEDLPYLETDIFSFKEDITHPQCVYVPEAVMYPSEIYKDEEGNVLLPKKSLSRVLGSKPFNGKVYIRSSYKEFSKDTPESELPYVEIPYDEEIILSSEYPYVEKRAITFSGYIAPSPNLYNQIKIELAPQAASCVPLPLFRGKVINVEYQPFKTADIIFREIPIADSRDKVDISFGVPTLMSGATKVDVTFEIPEKRIGSSKVDALVNVGGTYSSKVVAKVNVVYIKTSESKADVKLTVEPIPISQSMVYVKVSAYKQGVSYRCRIQYMVPGKTYGEGSLRILFDRYKNRAYFVPVKFISMYPGSNSMFILADIVKIGNSFAPIILNAVKESVSKIDVKFSSFAESRNKVNITANCYKEGKSSRCRVEFDAQKEANSSISIYFDKYLEGMSLVEAKIGVHLFEVSGRLRMRWIT